MSVNDKFDRIYNLFTKHGSPLPTVSYHKDSTERQVIGRFIQGIREKILSKTAVEEEINGMARINAHVSSKEFVHARVAQESEEWTEEELTKLSNTLTKFQEKIGLPKRPPNISKGTTNCPFSKEEQWLGIRISYDIKRIRKKSRHIKTIGLSKRMKIYADRGLVEFLPDGEGKCSTFSTPEMRNWNYANGVVVNETAEKPTKTNNNRRSTRSSGGGSKRKGRPTRSSTSMRTSRPYKRKATAEGSSSTVNSRRSKLTKAPQQVEEEEFCKLSEDEAEKAVLGIINLGNTCYVATSLQILFSSIEFITALHASYTSKSNEKVMRLTELVLDIAKHIGLINDEGAVQGIGLVDLVNAEELAADPTSFETEVDKLTNQFHNRNVSSLGRNRPQRGVTCHV